MITVASSTSTNWNWGGSTATLRFFPTEAFITSAGVNVLQGNVSQNEYYFSVSCTVSGNTLTIPQFTIDATTDGTPVTARYNAWLYDSNGTKRKLFLGNFAVPHNIASTSWENIVNYNDANPIIRPSFDVYTKDQVDALISNNSASVATLASTYGNSIATAVSTIGSSEVDLVIDADTTVSATTVIPSNIRVRIEGEPLISVASGQTLTINHMAPLGHQKVFDTSAGGTVVLPAATFDHVKLAWWGGTDSSDKTDAFNSAIANCSANGGGTIKLIDGIVNVAGELDNLPGDIVVEGVGSNRDGSARTVLTLTGLTSTYIFKITGGLINFTFRNLTVDLSTSTTCSAVLVDVADGETAADIIFDNFAVRGTGTSAAPQLYFSPNSLIGEIQSVRFLNGCQFVPGPSTSAIKCGTADSWFYFQQPKFSMGANAVGFEVAGVGSIEMDQPLFVGTGTQGYSDTLNRTITASITTGTKNVTLNTGTFTQSDLGQKITIAGAVTSSYIDSITSSTTATIHDNATATVAAASTGIYRQSGDTTMPLAGLKVTGTFTNITLNSSQDEGLQNFITQTGSALRGTITVNSALIQSPITADGNATVILNECHTWSGTLNDSSGAATVFRVRGGFLGEITWGTSRTLLTPSIWGVHDGASFLAENTAQVSQVYTTGRRQSFGIPTDIKHDNAYVGNPETTVPVFGVGSAFVDKPLIRIGQTDTVTNDWTQYYEMARVSSGHLSFTGNQTGFKGYDFDAIVKAQLLTFGTTSITPDNPTNVFASEGSVCLLTPTQDTTLNLANPIKANLLFFIQVLTSGTTSYTVTFGTGFAARGVLVTGTSSGTLHTIGFTTNNGATVAQEIYRTTTQIPDMAGNSGKYLTTSGTALSWGSLGSLAALSSINNSNWSGTALSIGNGGTGQTSQQAAIDALVPSQTSNSGKFLTTNGTTVSWGTAGGGMTVGSAVTSGGANRVLYEDGSQNLAASANMTYGASASQLKLIAGAASDVPFNIKAAASQTGNLLEVDSSAGSGGSLFKITSSGQVIVPASASTTASNIQFIDTGNLSFPTGIQLDGASNGAISFYSGGARQGSWRGNSGWVARDNHQFLWVSSSDATTGTLDTGLARFSAGVLRASDGSTGIKAFLGGGASVASATALPLPTGRVFHVTGTTTITSITATNLQSGVVITLIFDGILTFTNGSNLKLNGNMTTAANSTITLVYDGTNFYEIARKP